MTEILKQKAEQAKILYKAGQISREDAKDAIEPYIKAFNEKSKEIATKYNQRPKLISFQAYVR